ncbi:hypothetical protein HRG_001304 [Hirsutella rhossiliensis]|uniref:Uncharacterized protein n=1 Tax=Hirsutella rhossiliensis TaxID=111463 RepID=A0A9P8N8V3_9HYPO|nr:uncharacterized protein HRG_01304 [Hirsutella rhossiliensis]KAH0968662.1 hypothetical protein HRG_01304 [Hirsutella rhossiliensis]
MAAMGNNNCAIKLVCMDGSIVLVLNSNTKPMWIEHENNTIINYEYTIESINADSFTTIVSAVDLKVFGDMLMTVLPSGRLDGSLSAFEIVYVCAKMGLLKNEVTTQEARKYVYMGLMKEATTLKGRSTAIVGVKRSGTSAILNSTGATPRPVVEPKSTPETEVETATECRPECEVNDPWGFTTQSVMCKKDRKKKKSRKVTETPVAQLVAHLVVRIRPHRRLNHLIVLVGLVELHIFRKIPLLPLILE